MEKGVQLKRSCGLCSPSAVSWTISTLSSTSTCRSTGAKVEPVKDFAAIQSIPTGDYGLGKALTNLPAGRPSTRLGGRRLLLLGRVIATRGPGAQSWSCRSSLP